MNKKLIKLITIAALTSSTEAIFGFGKKVSKADKIDHNSTEIVIEEGDQEIGELIYHPANVDPYDSQSPSEEIVED